MPASNSSTRARLLESAEAEFGQHGFESCSLRRITKNAKANLAAVNYHFGSKEALYREVFLNRVRPINRRRIELLDQAIAVNPPGKTASESILEAFIRPVFETLHSDRNGHFLPLLSRSFLGNLPFMRELISREFDPIVKRFMQELRRTHPGTANGELLWNFLFASGSMLFVAAHHRDLEDFTHGLCRTDDLDAMVAGIVRFCARGMG